MASDEPWVGIRDVAAHLHVSKDTVYRWVDKQGLPAHRVGRLFRFRLSQVDEWVQNHGGDVPPNEPPDTAQRNSGDRESNG